MVYAYGKIKSTVWGVKGKKVICFMANATRLFVVSARVMNIAAYVPICPVKSCLIYLTIPSMVTREHGCIIYETGL